MFLFGLCFGTETWVFSPRLCAVWATMPGWSCTQNSSPHPKSKIKNQKSQKNPSSGPPPPMSELPLGGKAINPILSFSVFGLVPNMTPSAVPPCRPPPELLNGPIATASAPLPAALGPMRAGATTTFVTALSVGLLFYRSQPLSFIRWRPSSPLLGLRPV